MLIESLNKWVIKRVNGPSVLQWCLLPICTMHLSFECFARELIILWVSSARVCAALWSGLCVEGSGVQSVE